MRAEDFADFLGMSLVIWPDATLTGSGRIKLPFGLCTAKLEPQILTGLDDSKRKAFVALVHVAGDVVLGALMLKDRQCLLTVLSLAKLEAHGPALNMFARLQITEAQHAVPHLLAGAKRIYAGHAETLKAIPADDPVLVGFHAALKKVA